MSVAMFTGDDALSWIQSEGVEAKWEALCARCPWATGYQHPDFVLPWYHIYRKRFLPVILLEYGEKGTLRGLLTLALSLDGNRLTGAGVQQAEYQGWIASEDTANDFISNAIDRLRAAFANAVIALKYLPPGIPLDWMHDRPELMKCGALRSHARPVMKIDEASMARQRTKKNHRQNYNRLKRLGCIGFERVTDHQRFVQVFEDICMQYDFRQAALYRHMPFSSDPLKKAFYLELHRRGMLHTTVLTVENEVVASHTGLLSKERAVHLGINTHAPAFAAHSPGNLLLAMLGVELVKEQLPMLDLTPGGDRYKEHFASEHDQVFELTIFAGAMKRLQAQALSSVKQLSRAGLHAAGYRRADVLAAFDNMKRLSGWESGQLVEKLRFRPGSGLWARQCSPRSTHGTGAELPIFRNRLIDVFKYEAGCTSAQRGAFFNMVMKRLEHSDQLYSYAPGEELLIACWAQYGAAETGTQPRTHGPCHTNDAVILSDLYVHRQLNNDELVQRFIEQLLVEISRTIPGARVHYRGGLATNLREILHRSGFSEARENGTSTSSPWQLVGSNHGEKL